MGAFLFRYRRVITIALLLGIPTTLISLAVSVDAGLPSTSDESFNTRRAVTSGATGATVVLGGVTDWVSSWFEDEEQTELERLTTDYNTLKEERARLVGLLQENARLRKLVGFQQRHPEYKLAAARVIARDISPYFRVLKVRVKTDAKIKPNMPVVVSEGVVGRVYDVFDNYADIVVLSDPRSNIDVVAQRNRARGVMRGLGHGDDYAVQVGYVSPTDLLKEGDMLVTSGMDEIFPSDLVVGKVTRVERKGASLFQDVKAEPVVDYSRLEEVFVIVGVQ